MNRKKITLSFKAKLLLGMACIILINTAVIGISCYTFINDRIVNQYHESSRQTIKQIDTYLTDTLFQITSEVNALRTNPVFYTAVLENISNRNNERYGKNLGDVADLFYHMQMSNDLIDSIYVYSDHGDFDDFIQTRNRDFSFKESQYYKYFQDVQASDMACFPAASDYVFHTIHPVIPVVYRDRINAIRIYICVALDTRKLEDYFEEHYLGFGGIYVKSENGDIISSGIPFETAMEQYMVESSESGVEGWKIYTAKDTTDLVDDLRYMRTLIIAELSIMCTLVFLLGTLVMDSITKPLDYLTRMMKSARENQYKKRFAYRKKDEIGQLADGFNEMSEEISQLVEKLNEKIEELKEEKDNVKKEQEERRAAELKALVAQINPHFLYNTLNTISWQAAKTGAKEASVLSTLLGRFFQSSLSKGAEYVTVEEEIVQIKTYLEIQKIRYRSKMDYTIELDPEIREYYMVHLAIQPLVENAIYHGIKLVERHGEILIKGEKTAVNGRDCIRFTVTDNGQGILQERLDTINRQLADGIVDNSIGYGIFNVNERVRLSYGPEYGLQLESTYNIGTRSVLTFPVTPKEAK